MKNKASKDTIQAWIHLHRAQQVLLEKVESALKQAKQPPLSWYDTLFELSKEKKSGLRQYEISQKVLLNKHNLSRLLDRLEKQNLVKRHECSEDGRGNTIIITDTGIETLKQMWPVYNQAIEQHFAAQLTPNDIEGLSEILSKIPS